VGRRSPVVHRAAAGSPPPLRSVSITGSDKAVGSVDAPPEAIPMNLHGQGR
jgi:hypothetical protein